VLTVVARHLLRVLLVALDAAGPSRSRLALRRLGLRLRRPVLFEPEDQAAGVGRERRGPPEEAVVASSTPPSVAPAAEEGRPGR
jgi:hypothetical protein